LVLLAMKNVVKRRDRGIGGGVVVDLIFAVKGRDSDMIRGRDGLYPYTGLEGGGGNMLASYKSEIYKRRGHAKT